MTLLEKLYRRIPENIAKPVHVANPDFLHNSLIIEENGTYDVSSFSIANVSVRGGSEPDSGSQEVQKNVVVEKTELTDWVDVGDGYYGAHVPVSFEELPLSATVVWDGVKYNCTRQGEGGEACYGEYVGEEILFTTYPFFIQMGYYADIELQIFIYINDDADHTIEIYTEGSEPEPTPEHTGELLFNSTFTTEDFGGGVCTATFKDVSNELNYSSIIVDFNGTRYTLDSTYNTGAYLFGASVNADTHEVDFSEYPVAIIYEESTVELMFITETSLTCTVKIWANSDPVSIGDEEGK